MLVFLLTVFGASHYQLGYRQLLNLELGDFFSGIELKEIAYLFCLLVGNLPDISLKCLKFCSSVCSVSLDLSNLHVAKGFLGFGGAVPSPHQLVQVPAWSRPASLPPLGLATETVRAHFPSALSSLTINALY